MRNILKKFGLPGTLIIVSLVIGCILSGTFVITEEINFSAEDDFYFYQVDITNTSYITSTEPANATFSMYVDEYSGLGPVPDSVPTSATLIIKDFLIPTGASVISYSESVNAIQNLETLKTLAETGKFDFYGTSSGTVGNTITVDSGKVIVTFSAGS